MVKKSKKASVVLLSIALLTTVVVGLSLNVNAMTPGHFDFDTWTGSGSVSVITIGDHATCIKLTYGDEEIDRLNYTVTATDGRSVITLKEEYLNTLANGRYSFWAEFFSEGRESFEYGMISDTQNEIIISTPTNRSTFVRLTYGDDEIDSSNYTVTENVSSTVITFKEGYLETLIGEYREYSFCGYFLDEYFPVILHLNVDKSIAPPADEPGATLADETTATPADEATAIPIDEATAIPEDKAVTSEDYRDSHKSPKTGDHASMKGWLVTLSLSVAGCAVALKTCRNRKNVTL